MTTGFSPAQLNVNPYEGIVTVVDPNNANSIIGLDPTLDSPYVYGQASTGEIASLLAYAGAAQLLAWLTATEQVSIDVSAVSSDVTMVSDDERVEITSGNDLVRMVGRFPSEGAIHRWDLIGNRASATVLNMRGADPTQDGASYAGDQVKLYVAGTEQFLFVTTAGGGLFGIFDKAAGGERGQWPHIADPAGGATQDAEARAAIIDILNLLEGFGWMAP